MAVPSGADEAWTLWQVIISLISGGALTSSLGFIFLLGRKSGQVDELGEKVEEQESALQALTDKSDTRHEDNIEAIHRVTTAVAAVPSKQDFQRLEDQIGRRMSETEAQLRASLAEFKQMLCRAYLAVPPPLSRD